MMSKILRCNPETGVLDTLASWRPAESAERKAKEKSRAPGKKIQGCRANRTEPMTLPASRKTQPKLTLEQLRTLPRFEADFDTPEGAILCLEDAYRRRNIESAVACKDFMIEGILMLMNYDPDLARDPEVRKRNAMLAERTYRREIAESWPDLEGVETFFMARQPYIEGVVKITQLRRLRMARMKRLTCSSPGRMKAGGC